MQNDGLDQLVMHRIGKDKVLGWILGSKKLKVFFHL